MQASVGLSMAPLTQDACVFRPSNRSFLSSPHLPSSARELSTSALRSFLLEVSQPMRSSLFNAALAIALTSSALAQLVPSPAYLPPAASSGDSTSSLSSLEQWSNLLGNTLFYYDAQRTGELGNTSRVDWRNSSCIDDGSDVNLDLNGGYFDAGDFIKASFPLGFVLSSLTWGAVDYGQGYELANQTAYLDGVCEFHPSLLTSLGNLLTSLS